MPHVDGFPFLSASRDHNERKIELVKTQESHPVCGIAGERRGSLINAAFSGFLPLPELDEVLYQNETFVLTGDFYSYSPCIFYIT